jgi:hypothetical protein
MFGGLALSGVAFFDPLPTPSRKTSPSATGARDDIRTSATHADHAIQ